MKILLDQSPKSIQVKSDRFDHYLWQLRTPLTRYAISDRPYGLDNGCFSTFNYKTWARMVRDSHAKRPLFICLPDVVGSARRTLELFDIFEYETRNLPRALVLQDGIGEFNIPWALIDAVFVGGSDEFKLSAEAQHAVRAAKVLNKWVHIGRVNTPKRIKEWIELGDSLDGSGISRYDHMLEAVVAELKTHGK